jgi:hypothetical protein
MEKTTKVWNILNLATLFYAQSFFNISAESYEDTLWYMSLACNSWVRNYT